MLEMVVPLRNPRRSPSSGFSLVEVLVAIVVLSFGLLGTVGLQAMALQNNREARLQSVAVNRARELAEMMRGNKAVALLSVANPYVGDFTGSPLAPANPSSCLNPGSSCASPLVAAKAELTDWLARVDADLPGARVTICPDSAPYDSDGLPRWACAAGAPTDVIVIKIGWSRSSTDSSLRDRTLRADSKSPDNRPGLIVPVTAGESSGGPL